MKFKGRRKVTREKEMEVITSPGEEAPKRDRKRRTNVKQQKSERGRTETPKPFGGPSNQNPLFKVNYSKRDESAGPSSSAALLSQSISARPSPIGTIPTALTRYTDEDDLVYPPPIKQVVSPSPSMRTTSHRSSISSTHSRASPPSSSMATSMKRPLSPGTDDVDPKRSKVVISSPAHEAECMSIDQTQPWPAFPQTQSAPGGKFVVVMNPSEPPNNVEPSS